jgi:hypothetical protein
MTAFALEVAALGSHKQAAAAARLIEWACPYVRAHTPVNDFDRAWQLAALAALEGGIDSTVLHAHLDHVQAGFGEDPRYALGRGVAEEQFGAPAEVLTRSATAANLARAREALARAEGERYRALDRAIARFREAARLPPVAAEATLRMGHVQHRLARHDAALETWSGIEPGERLPHGVEVRRGQIDFGTPSLNPLGIGRHQIGGRVRLGSGGGRHRDEQRQPDRFQHPGGSAVQCSLECAPTS